MAIGLCVLLPVCVYACAVPVFRYALERWPADYYEAVVIHRTPLDDDHPAVSVLKGEDAEFLNLRLSKIDMSTATDEEIKNTLGGPPPETIAAEGPAIAIWYPWQRGRAAPFYTGDFTPEKIKALIHSPKRKELAKRLNDGQSAVWIFVESGNKSKDSAAMQILTEELAKATEELKEIAPSVAEEAETPGLTFSFSILPVSRTDPNEQMLLTMLLKSEPDLDEYADGPIVFPVFGRGRALYALAGEGINPDNIREAIGFITGPCGCEIKMLNPGVDLIMDVNWDAAVMQFYEEFSEFQEEELPQLTSVFPDEADHSQHAMHAAMMESNLTAENKEKENNSEISAPSAVKTESGKVEGQQFHGFPVLGAAVVSLGGIVLVVALGTFALNRKKK